MLTVFKYQWQFNHNVCKVVFNISDNEIHLHNQNALSDALFMEQIYVQKISHKIWSHNQSLWVQHGKKYKQKRRYKILLKYQNQTTSKFTYINFWYMYLYAKNYRK